MIEVSIRTFWPFSSAGLACSISLWSSAFPASHDPGLQYGDNDTSAGTAGLMKTRWRNPGPGLPVFDTGAHIEQIGTTNQIVELADAQLGHDQARASATKKK